MEDPTSSELKKEKEILNALSLELENNIENRQKQIDQNTINGSVSSEVKNAVINKLDPSYFQNVEAINKLKIEESERIQKLLTEEITLLSKVNNELFSLEEALINNADDQEKIDNRKKLEAIRTDLRASIENLNEQKSNLTSGTTVSTQEKSNKIIEIDPAYLSEKESIEENSDLTNKEKAQQLLKLENEFIELAFSEQYFSQTAAMQIAVWRLKIT